MQKGSDKHYRIWVGSDEFCYAGGVFSAVDGTCNQLLLYYAETGWLSLSTHIDCFMANYRCRTFFNRTHKGITARSQDRSSVYYFAKLGITCA